jgi:hypothetical protein
VERFGWEVMPFAEFSVPGSSIPAKFPVLMWPTGVRRMSARKLPFHTGPILRSVNYLTQAAGKASTETAMGSAS